MGYVHAKIFVDNKVFSFLSIVFVGALAGLFLTILSPHYGPEGESQLFWFIIGAVTNIFVYSIFSSTLLLYIPSYIGWYIGNKK